jgi:hypothetical protein
MGDEANAAGIMLVRRLVETLFRTQVRQAHAVSLKKPVGTTG